MSLCTLKILKGGVLMPKQRYEWIIFEEKAKEDVEEYLHHKKIKVYT